VAQGMRAIGWPFVWHGGMVGTITAWTISSQANGWDSTQENLQKGYSPSGPFSGEE